MGDLDELATAAAGGHPPTAASDDGPSEWSVYWLGQYYGPYTYTELAGYIRSGQVLSNAQVNRPGMSGWMPVSEAFALPALVQSAPIAYESARRAGAMAGPLRLTSTAVVPFWAALACLALLAGSMFLNYLTIFAGGFAAISVWWGKVLLVTSIAAGTWLFAAARLNPRPTGVIACVVGVLTLALSFLAHQMYRMYDKDPGDGLAVLVAAHVGPGPGAYLSILACSGAMVCLAVTAARVSGPRYGSWQPPYAVACVLGVAVYILIAVADRTAVAKQNQPPDPRLHPEAYRRQPSGW